MKCNDTIRLEHLKTGKNLHSHNFASPVSKQQEVSAYGVNGEGDESLLQFISQHSLLLSTPVTFSGQLESYL